MNRVWFHRLSVALLVLLGFDSSYAAGGADSSEVAPASGDIADPAIRAIVARVAKHQIRVLDEGDYPAVRSIAEARAARPPAGIAWDYPWGVTLCGMSRSTAVTGDPAADQFVSRHNAICGRYYAWLSGLERQLGQSNASAFVRSSKIKGLMTLGSLDNCGAMGNEMLESMIRHPERVTPEEKEVVARIADWIITRQERLVDGTLWRSNSMGGTLWPDDLYMGAVFLTRWGKYTGVLEYIQDAASQIIHQAAVQQDTDGLWFHGYLMSEKKHAPFKWGRGNGWVTVALVETIPALPEPSPLRLKLIEILKHQIDGLKQVQTPEGMWRQVLDHRDLWEETSCTAMFAYGIATAVNHGWIDASHMTVARQAFAGVAKHIGADGAVNGTCEGTSIGEHLNYYVLRSRPEDDLHGPGAVLLAGTAILGNH